MANVVNTQTGGVPQGAAVAQKAPAIKPAPGVEQEAPEGAKAAKAATGGKGAVGKAAGGKGAATQVPANLPPGAEWEAPEGAKAAKMTAAKTATGKGTAGAIATKTTTGTVATSKAATGKSLAATGAVATGKGALAAAPGSLAVKGITSGGSFWSGSLPALGISLGGLTPILTAGAAAALGVGIYSYIKNKKKYINELDDALS
ncbi:MAG: cell wall protein TIR3 precursor [Magnetococcales bacterium]|nr:cell wall protein TIR3 precursor [Magnetococcales bacterium]HIJ83592.1 hypothetical protein [Magnetococcales bacterium]